MPQNLRPKLKNKAKAQTKTINGNFKIKIPNQSHNALCY